MISRIGLGCQSVSVSAKAAIAIGIENRKDDFDGDTDSDGIPQIEEILGCGFSVLERIEIAGWKSLTYFGGHINYLADKRSKLVMTL